MLKLLKKWIKRRRIMMINYFAMQIEFGWILWKMSLKNIVKK
ncbi:phage protein [Streptococcus dysgalactiae]|nr:phage protein [Streptococcus dysgalactiae]